MRTVLAALLLLAGCGSESVESGPIELQTKDIVVHPGEETTYCYYLHTKNDVPVAVNKWVSDMTPGSHHMIIYANPSGYQPEDDMFDAPCPIVGRTQPIWIFSSQKPGHDEWALPVDDGAGKPLGQLIDPHTAVFLQMHFINETDADLMVHVNLKGEVLPVDSEFTPTSGYMAYNNSIAIPPGAVNHLETATCDLPPDVKFWAMVTHSHKQTIHTAVMDGPETGPVVFQDTDWEHPVTQFWDADPFYKFTDTKLTWTCTYNNTGDNAATTVYSGQSSVTDEMCVVGGFYFPATKPLACIWDTSIPGGCSCSTTGG
jgi:hypothetical protein